MPAVVYSVRFNSDSMYVIATDVPNFIIYIFQYRTHW